MSKGFSGMISVNSQEEFDTLVEIIRAADNSENLALEYLGSSLPNRVEMFRFRIFKRDDKGRRYYVK